MPTEHAPRTLLILELLFLFLSGPFLLFPDILPWVTAFMMLLVVGAWLYGWKMGAFPLPSTPFNAALLLLAIMIFVAIVISADRDLTLSKATGLFLGFAAWRYIVFYVRDRRGIWVATFVFACVGLAMMAVGILSANWNFSVGFVQRLFPALPPRLIILPGAADAGIQTNQLGGTMLFYLFLPFTFICDFRAFNARLSLLLIAITSALLLSALLLLTQSRSAWMGAVGGFGFLIFLYALLAPPRSKWRLVLFSLLLIGLVTAVFVGIQVWPTVIAAFYEPPPTTSPLGTLESLSFRYEVWHWAIEAIRDFPFTGTGLGTFRRVVLRLYPTPFTMDFAHAHNIFFQVALDVGLPGLVAYVSTLILSLIAGWNAAVDKTRIRPLVLGLITGLVAFHIYGLTDALALGSKTTIAFWIVLGLLSVSWNLEMR